MNKSILLIFYFLFSLTPATHAQFNWVKQWDHRYGGIDGDYVIAFERTSDDGFILAGKTASDSTGNKTTHIFGNGAFDYWIIKLNSFGILQWEKDFRGSGNDPLWSLGLTADGGFIIGGTSDSPIGGDKSQSSRGGTDYWIIKLDSLGNKIWDKTFGGTDDEDLHSVIQTSDGGFLIGGDSRSRISGDKSEAKFGINDYWIVKTDSAGTIQWDNAYGGIGDDNLQAFIKTTGGGFMCGGWSTSGISGDKTQPSNGQYDIWILKINSSGNIEWDKDFGGTGIEDEFSSIYQTYDGGFLLGVTSYSNAGGDKSDNNLGVEQPWIIKTDSIGNKLWDKTIFTNGHNENALIKETSNHKCYVIVSGDNGLIGGDKSEDAWGGFSSDYWIVKFCQGEATSVNDLESNSDDLFIYPNPFSNELKIRSNTVSPNSITTFTIFDIVGNNIISQKFNGETTVNTSSLTNGIYLLEVIIDGQSWRKKTIIK